MSRHAPYTSGPALAPYWNQLLGMHINFENSTCLNYKTEEVHELIIFTNCRLCLICFALQVKKGDHVSCNHYTRITLSTHTM